MDEQKTLAWRQYETGVDYKTRIGLYKTVDLNERFYAGDQWAGIPHEGLPTPVVNFIKYASGWKIAAVSDRRTAMSFYADGADEDGQISVYARQVSDYCDTLWEKLRMDYITKEGLKQAAITGDYIQFFYWDTEIKTGQDHKGDIQTQLIDNVNYYPGNPNTPDVQKQPYIIIISRDMTENVREEARKNGISEDEIALIKSDADTEYTSGDRGKIELDDDDKVNVLWKFYKKDGKVWMEKATRQVVFQPAKNTKLTRYPIAMMNWDTRKNSCHGEAEVTHLIPNQVYVNKQLAITMCYQMSMSTPKVLFNRSDIKKWSNKIAGAIPVNGDPTKAAYYLTPPAMNYDAWRGVETILEQTMRVMGANAVALGDIKNPDNTSAFIATRDAAMVPLLSHQERFYEFLEDIGLIWMDFIRNFYKGGRKIPVEQDGQRLYVEIPEKMLDKFEWKIKIEPGPSTTWGETQALQTLDNLFLKEKITSRQYVERLPAGRIPKQEELVKELQKMEQQQAQQAAPQQAQPQPQQQPQQQQSVDPRVADLIQRIAQGVKGGVVQQEAAQQIAQAAQQGATFEELLEGVKQFIQQGAMSPEILKTAA